MIERMQTIDVNPGSGQTEGDADPLTDALGTLAEVVEASLHPPE